MGHCAWCSVPIELGPAELIVSAGSIVYISGVALVLSRQTSCHKNRRFYQGPHACPARRLIATGHGRFGGRLMDRTSSEVGPDSSGERFRNAFQAAAARSLPLPHSTDSACTPPSTISERGIHPWPIWRVCPWTLARSIDRSCWNSPRWETALLRSDGGPRHD